MVYCISLSLICYMQRTNIMGQVSERKVQTTYNNNNSNDYGNNMKKK